MRRILNVVPRPGAGRVLQTLQTRACQLEEAGWKTEVLVCESPTADPLQERRITWIRVEPEATLEPSLVEVLTTRDYNCVNLFESTELLRSARKHFTGQLLLELGDRGLIGGGLDPATLALADRIVAPSLHSKQEVLDRVPDLDSEKVLVSRPSAEGRHFQAEAAPTPPGVPPTLVWAGALDSTCAWRDGVRVLGVVCREHPESEAILATWGQTAPDSVRELLAELAACDLLYRARWLHDLGNHALAGLFRRAASNHGALLTTHPCDRSGALAILALASGLPVVAARGGAMPEVVAHDHNGLLFPPDDPLSAAPLLRSLLSDPELPPRLGKGAASSRSGDDDQILSYPQILASEKKAAVAPVEAR